MFSQGILKQGVYTAVVKYNNLRQIFRYWDYLRLLSSDFFTSKRQMADIRYFLNEPRFETANTMQDYYFKIVMLKLALQLQNDISQLYYLHKLINSFGTEGTGINALFACFIIMIVLLYFVVWRWFLSSVSQELWRSKSWLTIVPPEKLFENPSMREYIIEHSSPEIINTTTAY